MNSLLVAFLIAWFGNFGVIEFQQDSLVSDYKVEYNQQNKNTNDVMGGDVTGI